MLIELQASSFRSILGKKITVRHYIVRIYVNKLLERY